MQKLNRRRTALQKTKAITEEVKAKWKPCMVLELISSEESEWEEKLRRSGNHAWYWN